MNHEEFERLASRHAEGETTADERQQLDEHVRSCPVCLEGVAESAAEADAAVAAGEEIPGASRRRPFFRWWLGAAALFFLALFGWSELRLRAEREDVLQLRATLDQLTTEKARIFRRGVQHISAASVIGSAKTTVVVMTIDGGPGSSARVFIDAESGRGYVFAHGLPAAPPGERYQLWTLPRDGTDARRIVTLDIAATGDGATAIDAIPPAAEISSIILTRESPTVASPGPAVLRGTL